jgi:putative colanic acid biosynthesis glycosyltransferase
MKVLIIDVNHGDSSTGLIVENLKNGLERRGHTVLSCYGRETGKKTAGGTRVSHNFEVYIHAALTRLTGLTGSFSPFATKRLIEILDNFQPDVVHLHELHGYYINYPAIIEYLKQRGIPTVFTFHCEFMYTGKCGYAFECEKWQSECHHCPQLHEYPSSLFFDRTNSMFNEKKYLLQDFHAVRIVTPSKWLSDRVKKSFLSAKQIDVVNNGIDTEYVFVPHDKLEARNTLGIKSKYVVTSIAPDLMSERKGGAWVLEVASRLLDKDITFVMVGVEGSLPISLPNVIAVPRIYDKRKLAMYYSMADVFLLTSKKETFSLVCAESLACGTPIIGFDAGAPVEVAPAGFGLFVPYGDVNEICNALTNSIERDSPFVSDHECVEYARTNFGIDIMVDRYYNIYSEMVNW